MPVNELPPSLLDTGHPRGSFSILLAHIPTCRTTIDAGITLPALSDVSPCCIRGVTPRVWSVISQSYRGESLNAVGEFVR